MCTDNQCNTVTPCRSCSMEQRDSLLLCSSTTIKPPYLGPALRGEGSGRAVVVPAGSSQGWLLVDGRKKVKYCIRKNAQGHPVFITVLWLGKIFLFFSLTVHYLWSSSLLQHLCRVNWSWHSQGRAFSISPAGLVGAVPTGHKPHNVGHHSS